MAGRAFSPATVTIAAGGSVTFRNDDDRAHTVTAKDGAFNSGTIAEGGSWKRTFKQAGTFSYLCAIHPEMTGKVVVKGSGGSARCSGRHAEAEAHPDADPDGGHDDGPRSRDPGLLVRAAEHQRSAGLDGHVAERRRCAAHGYGFGRLIRLRDDRGRWLVGPHLRNGRDLQPTSVRSIRRWRAWSRSPPARSRPLPPPPSSVPATPDRPSPSARSGGSRSGRDPATATARTRARNGRRLDPGPELRGRAPGPRRHRRTADRRRVPALHARGRRLGSRSGRGVRCQISARVVSGAESRAIRPV